MVYKEIHERTVPRKPREESVSSRKESLIIHAAERASRMGTEDSLLGLAAQMSVFTFTEATVFFQTATNLFGQK